MKREETGRQVIGDSLDSIEQVARRLGLEPLGSGGWFNGPCPREGCEDEDKSFYLYPPGHYHCYSCGCSGGVADLKDTLVGGAKPGTNGHGRNGPSSRSRSLYRSGREDGGSGLELVSLASVPRPDDERPVVIEGMIPCGFPSILYGDGGTAKSLIATSMLLAVARGAPEWMGRKVKRHGPAIYMDFELDLQEQARRAYQLAEGLGLDALPENFHYLSGADHPVRDVLEYARERARELGAVLALLDSLGFAVEGDMEASRDMLRFTRDYIKPFQSAGVTLLIVDHQAKLTGGESYHQKSPFGSVFKSNACRSVLQVGVEDQRDGELTVRFRHQKANFGSKFDPFEAHLVFHSTKVEITHRALTSEDLASEGSLNTAQKIRRLLADGPMFPEDLAEKMENASEKTVKNNLTAMRKRGEVIATGETSETGSQQVALADRPPVPSSKGSGREDGGSDTDHPANCLCDTCLPM